MNISENGLDLIKICEGCVLHAYPDEGAYSIGYGHRGVPAGAVCNQQQADDWLASDLKWTVAELNRLIYVALTQDQFDALCSLAYNIGIGAFEHSTLLQLLNAKNYSGAAAEFIRWCHADGAVDENLLARRKKEMALFQAPDFVPCDPEFDP